MLIKIVDCCCADLAVWEISIQNGRSDFVPCSYLRGHERFRCNLAGNVIHVHTKAFNFCYGVLWCIKNCVRKSLFFLDLCEMALDPEQYLRTVQREYLDFIDDDVS